MEWLFAVTVRCGSLCFLDCQPLEQANVAGFCDIGVMVIWAMMV